MKVTNDTVILETHEEKLYHKAYNLAFEGAMNEYINLEYDPDCKDNSELLKKKTLQAKEVIDHVKGIVITMNDLSPDEIQTWRKIKLEVEIKRSDSGIR